VYQPSEVVSLLLVIGLTPVMYRGIASLRIPGRRLLIAGYLALAVAYVATIAEGYWAPDLLNAVEHALYAASGILFAAGLVRLAVASRRGDAR